MHALFRTLAVVMLLLPALRNAARAGETVTFPRLDGAFALTAELSRPTRGGAIPAIVMLHGCSGLGRSAGPFGIYRAWRDLFLAQGYAVLMVDSAASRGFGQTCTLGEANTRMTAERPGDAYAALAYLQHQDFIRPDRIALVGWSQGGGAVLRAIPVQSSGRPVPPPGQDFAASVAFYPGLCSDRLQSAPYTPAAPQSWTTRIPLLVLQGEADNWTPAKPCLALLHAAQDRGAPVTWQVYPGAVHGFDAPNIKVHPIEGYRRGDWRPLVGTDPAARDDALARVINFLATRLAP